MPSQKVATTDGHLGVRIELELAVRRVDTPAEADANSLSPLGGVANVLGTNAGENGKIGSLEYTDAAPAHSFPVDPLDGHEFVHLVGVFTKFKLAGFGPWKRGFFAGPAVGVVLALLFESLCDEVHP